ncbi:hypothetical protein SRHO_G00207680 [Serrasalmus rhombeus]
MIWIKFQAPLLEMPTKNTPVNREELSQSGMDDNYLRFEENNLLIQDGTAAALDSEFSARQGTYINPSGPSHRQARNLQKSQHRYRMTGIRSEPLFSVGFA